MKKTYQIEVDCPNCANLCEDKANKVEGVAIATINFMTQKMLVEFNEGVNEKKVIKEIYRACKKIEPDFSIITGGVMTKKQKRNLIRIIITVVLIVVLNLIQITGIVRGILFLLCYLIIGYDILIKAFKGIINGRVLDENFLMTVATIGAMALGIYTRTGDYNEAIAVMLFYQVGEWFQSYAVGKSRKSISALMDIRPDYANVKREGKIIQVCPESVHIGDEIIVRPGDKIPLDGVVILGKSSLNTSALTGESLPREIGIGDEVSSGCININGVITIKTTKEFEESTASKILKLVESASSKKAKAESFISRFSRYYTPVVCIGAVALAILPPFFRLIVGLEPGLSSWVYRALTFLVISCPCALVISVPLTFFAGIGGASREGILIKGSNYLEALSNTKYILFDKTGTLTQGVFEIIGVHHNIIEEIKLIEYSALAESGSKHPISRSIQRAYGKEIDSSRVSEIQEVAGMGTIALVDNKRVAIGNHKLMEKVGAEYKLCHKAGTVTHIAIDGVYAGHIVISDVIKRQSAETISKLKKMGIKKTIMLTGDSESVAKSVSETLHLDEYHSELLPEDKLNWIEDILNKKTGREKVAFVGDGINDAPVLSRADIGIAMGGIGSDATIESADIVLMDDNPVKIAKAIRISRKTIRIVKENVCFALGIKTICLILGAFGITDMWFAVFADVGVMIIAIFNAIRALKIR